MSSIFRSVPATAATTTSTKIFCGRRRAYQYDDDLRSTIIRTRSCRRRRLFLRYVSFTVVGVLLIQQLRQETHTVQFLNTDDIQNAPLSSSTTSLLWTQQQQQQQQTAAVEATAAAATTTTTTVVTEKQREENKNDNTNAMTKSSSSSRSLSLSSYFSSTNNTNVYERNFFYRAWHDSLVSTTTTTTTATAPSRSTIARIYKQRKQHLPPMRVMTTYITQHSQQQLEKEWQECQQQLQQQRQQQSRKGQRHRSSLVGISNNTDTSIPNSTTRDIPVDTNTNKDLDDFDSDYCPTIQQERRYLVASYSCPIESGNRLHRYMNGLVWAILTNRTLLWRYHTSVECEEYQEKDCLHEYNPTVITGPHDCHGLIEKSAWIPAYDHWNYRIHQHPHQTHDLVLVGGELYDGQQEKDEGVRMDSNNTTTTTTTTTTLLPYDSEENETTNRRRIIRAGKQVQLNPGGILTMDDKQLKKAKYLSQPHNRQRLHDLRSHGVYFVYGMFFEALFTIDAAVDPSPDLVFHHNNLNQTEEEGVDHRHTETETETVPETHTIFMHSRHAGKFPIDYIYPEVKCLRISFPKVEVEEVESVVNRNETTTTTKSVPVTATTTHVTSNSSSSSTQNQNQHHPCHIYVMSDQPVTVELLHKAIQNVTRCTSSSTTTTTTTSMPMSIPTNNTDNRTESTDENQDARRLKKREARKPKQKKKESTTKSISFRDEHGPRAGRGYWEDVALAIQARHGMIAFHMHHRKDNLVRTSTALVRELVEFRRLVEYYYYSSHDLDDDNDTDDNDTNEDTVSSSLPDFVECTTPWEKGSRKKKRNEGGRGRDRKKKRKATGEKKSVPT